MVSKLNKEFSSLSREKFNKDLFDHLNLYFSDKTEILDNVKPLYETVALEQAIPIVAQIKELMLQYFPTYDKIKFQDAFFEYIETIICGAIISFEEGIYDKEEDSLPQIIYDEIVSYIDNKLPAQDFPLEPSPGQDNQPM